MSRFALILTLYIASSITLLGCNISTTPDGAFLKQLRAHCGEAFAGQIVTNDEADNDWRAQRIVMHVRDCSDDEIKIALHVGENRSRTWILRYEDMSNDTTRLALRHDHRHEDGSADSVTYYGGHAADIGPNRISFPADPSTKELFDRENISVSKSNVWALELWPSNDVFVYEMTRPNRNFKIEFDTSKAVETPPVPWGW